MVNYLKGTTQDYADIVDFGNYVFKNDFIEILPKLYDGQVDTTACHFLAKEDDKIKAMVGSFPLELNVLGQPLKGFGIGTVSVHPYSRSKGYMKILMQNAMDSMYEAQADFAVLSGQKQRYEYFGFTPSGTTLYFTVTSTNLRHKGIISQDIIHLENFDMLSPNAVKVLHHMHCSKSLHSTRSLKHFTTICKNWNSKAFAIYNHTQQLTGYVICTGSTIHDFYLADPELLHDLLATVMKTLSLNELSLSLGAFEYDFIPCLIALCESYQIHTATSLNILNYQNFIAAFLNFKQSYSSLEKGRLVLEIIDREKLLIEVGENIMVRQTDESPDISLTHLNAIHFLCDPVQILPVTLLSKQNLIRSWFPLPFTYCSIDNV